MNEAYEVIHDSFVLSLMVCSVSISLSAVMLLMVWLFVRNKDEFYDNGKKVSGYGEYHKRQKHKTL
jgi:hypothetical protein